MGTRMASRLERFFREETEDSLRSVVHYEPDSAEIVYLREDVAEQYAEEAVAKAVDESRMASLAAPIYEDMYAEDHGELTCLVQCFDNVIEMNFVLGDGIGSAVAVDATAMAQSHGLVSEARQIVVEERD